MESIIILGIGALSAIILASSVNSGAITSTLASLSDAQAASLTSQINVLSTYNVSFCLIGIWERIIAIGAHLALSVVVFTSIYEKGRKYLFPTAILLHAIFDIPAVLYQRGALGLIPTELILTAVMRSPDSVRPIPYALLYAGAAALSYLRYVSQPVLTFQGQNPS